MLNGEINPLNVHNLRRVDWCPPHFTKVVIPKVVNERGLNGWIYENLSGRFCLDVVDLKDPHTKFGTSYTRHTFIAFENAGEASYFSLCLPEILKQISY